MEERTNLQDWLSDELYKEISSDGFASLDIPFMQKAMAIRPSALTNQEIDIRVEILALRLRKLIKKVGLPTCR